MGCRSQPLGTLSAVARTADVKQKGIMAALRGGYLPARTARDTTPLEIALDMALDQVRAYAVEPGTAANRHDHPADSRMSAVRDAAARTHTPGVAPYAPAAGDRGRRHLVHRGPGGPHPSSR